MSSNISQIILKRSSVAGKQPTPTSLNYGELAVNYADGKIFFRKSDNTLGEFTTDNSITLVDGTSDNDVFRFPMLHSETILSGKTNTMKYISNMKYTPNTKTFNVPNITTTQLTAVGSTMDTLEVKKTAKLPAIIDIADSVTENVTITKNSVSVSGVSVADGVTVTVQDGATWKILNSLRVADDGTSYVW